MRAIMLLSFQGSNLRVRSYVLGPSAELRAELPDVALKPRPSGRGYKATICRTIPVLSQIHIVANHPEYPPSADYNGLSRANGRNPCPSVDELLRAKATRVDTDQHG